MEHQDPFRLAPDLEEGSPWALVDAGPDWPDRRYFVTMGHLVGRFCWGCQAYYPVKRFFPCGHVGPEVVVLERAGDAQEDLRALNVRARELMRMDQAIGGGPLEHLGSGVPGGGIWCDICVKDNHILKERAHRFTRRESGIGLIPVCQRHFKHYWPDIPLDEGWREYVTQEVMEA